MDNKRCLNDGVTKCCTPSSSGTRQGGKREAKEHSMSAGDKFRERKKEGCDREDSNVCVGGGVQIYLSWQKLHVGKNGQHDAEKYMYIVACVDQAN